MRKLLIILLVLLLLPMPVYAAEYAPPSPEGNGEKYMPENTESFAEGLWSILLDGISALQPTLYDALKICCSVIAAVMMLSLVRNFSVSTDMVLKLVETMLLATILIGASNTLIDLAANTVNELSDYGKLLLPVMTGAMAAQGSGVTSAALYTGTAVFDAILSTAISKLLTPMIYIYLVLAVAVSATGQVALNQMLSFVKWLVTWALKISLYIFTGYMSVTRVISGSVDAAAIKATKLTISGMVPVVGGILSDASETILVSASIMKNSIGVYGLLAIAAICVEPFLRIGFQYLALKVTGAICGVFGGERAVALVKHFTTAMGLLLAMTGAVGLMLLVSVICFMKGVA